MGAGLLLARETAIPCGRVSRGTEEHGEALPASTVSLRTVAVSRPQDLGFVHRAAPPPH